MPASSSEAYLFDLAERSFLKLWTLANTYYAPNRELSDLVIPFGDDVVIISDKAIRFDDAKPIEIAWPRWYRNAIQDSLRQLKTAKQRLVAAPSNFFTDVHASAPVPGPLGAVGAKRFHLVAIARPDTDPAVVPAGWHELRYVPDAGERPFHIGRLDLAEQPVHVFDGPTIDLLLREFDTAPDFIAYLREREARLREGGDYSFVERDLIGSAQMRWDAGSARLPTLPPLADVADGTWALYDASEIAALRRKLDAKGRIIDAYILQTHGEFDAGKMLGDQPSFASHEHAMRLLASESRFARRVIAHELWDILDEPVQTTFWASTVTSPTHPDLRYVWLTYPPRPDWMTAAEFDDFMNIYIRKHVYVAQALFPETYVLGIAMPNRSASDTAMFTALHDKSSWTPEDQAEGLKLQSEGIFSNLEAIHRVHFP